MSRTLEGKTWQRCRLCNAEYGHVISCPTWTGNVVDVLAKIDAKLAELDTVDLLQLSEEDRIRLHGMGVLV